MMWKRWPSRPVLPQRRDDGPGIQFLDRRMRSVRQETALNFEMGVRSSRSWPDPAGDLWKVECCLTHQEQAARSVPKMSLVVHRRADAGIKSIGWNLDVWTKVGQRPISKFQNDANLGPQLGTFAARSVAARPRQTLRRRVEQCSGRRKRGPKIQRQDQEIFSCSPVRESWMNCQDVVNLGVEMDCRMNGPILSKSRLGNPARSAPHLPPTLAAPLTTCTVYRKVWLQGTFSSKFLSFLVPGHSSPTSAGFVFSPRLVTSNSLTDRPQPLLCVPIFPPRRRDIQPNTSPAIQRPHESTDNFSARHSRSRRLRF